MLAFKRSLHSLVCICITLMAAISSRILAFSSGVLPLHRKRTVVKINTFLEEREEGGRQLP